VIAIINGDMNLDVDRSEAPALWKINESISPFLCLIRFGTGFPSSKMTSTFAASKALIISVQFRADARKSGVARFGPAALIVGDPLAHIASATSTDRPPAA
jgi:hypothetical protein